MSPVLKLASLKIYLLSSIPSSSIVKYFVFSYCSFAASFSAKSSAPFNEFIFLSSSSLIKWNIIFSIVASFRISSLNVLNSCASSYSTKHSPCSKDFNALSFSPKCACNLAKCNHPHGYSGSSLTPRLAYSNASSNSPTLVKSTAYL